MRKFDFGDYESWRLSTWCMLKYVKKSLMSEKMVNEEFPDSVVESGEPIRRLCGRTPLVD